MRWAIFEEEFGPLTLHERIDAMAVHISGRPIEWRVVRPLSEDAIPDWLGALSRKRD